MLTARPAAWLAPLLAAGTPARLPGLLAAWPAAWLPGELAAWPGAPRCLHPSILLLPVHNGIIRLCKARSHTMSHNPDDDRATDSLLPHLLHIQVSEVQP